MSIIKKIASITFLASIGYVAMWTCILEYPSCQDAMTLQKDNPTIVTLCKQ